MKNCDLADLGRINLKEVLTAGEKASEELGLQWIPSLTQLVECLRNHPELIPGKIVGVDLKSALTIWLRKYQHGLNNRFKTRVAKPSSVKRDPILQHVLKVSNPNLSTKSIEDIFENHVLAMAIENGIGSLLEDYIASKLEPQGWIPAWGSVLRAIDFYEPKTDKFLQVKNRSNSENSSSMSIRKGTNIEKWYRINAQNGQTHWEKLEKITGVSGMSEEEFFLFTKEAISQNPKLFYFGIIDPAKEGDPSSS